MDIQCPECDGELKGEGSWLVEATCQDCGQVFEVETDYASEDTLHFIVGARLSN